MNCIYKNNKDKACFAHDGVYADSKDLNRRPVLDKFLKDRAYEIALEPEHDGYQGGFSSMEYMFFDKKTI